MVHVVCEKLGAYNYFLSLKIPNRMTASKMISVLGMLCILLATVAFNIGLTTNKWIVTTETIQLGKVMEIASAMMSQPTPPTKDSFLTGSLIPSRTIRDLSQQMSQGRAMDPEKLMQMAKHMLHNIPDSSQEMMKSLSVEVELSFGLKDICIDVNIRSEELPKVFLKAMKKNIKAQEDVVLKCYSTDYMEQLSKMLESDNDIPPNLMQVKKMLKRSHKGLDDTQICIICAVVLSSLALIASFIKLPCVNISTKKVVLCITVFLTVSAVSAAMAGVVHLKQKVHIKDDVYEMKDMTTKLIRANLEYASQLEQAFDMAKLSEKYSYSHILVCLGIAFLFIAVLMNVGELVGARKSKVDEHEISLMSKEG